MTAGASLVERTVADPCWHSRRKRASSVQRMRAETTDAVAAYGRYGETSLQERSAVVPTGTATAACSTPAGFGCRNAASALVQATSTASGSRTWNAVCRPASLTAAVLHGASSALAERAEPKLAPMLARALGVQRAVVVVVGSVVVVGGGGGGGVGGGGGGGAAAAAAAAAAVSAAIVLRRAAD